VQLRVGGEARARRVIGKAQRQGFLMGRQRMNPQREFRNDAQRAVGVQEKSSQVGAYRIAMKEARAGQCRAAGPEQFAVG
jgi:hypothetical protein